MTTRVPICLTIGAVISVVWLLFIRLPLQREQQTAHAELAEVQKQIDEFSATVNLLPSFLRERDELEQRATQATSRLYVKSEVLKLFEQLRQQAQDHDLRLLEITPPVAQLIQMNQIMANSADPLFLDVSLRLSGDFLNFGRYVETLEQSPYFRGINRCLIAADVTDNRSTAFLIDFRAVLGGGKGVS